MRLLFVTVVLAAALAPAGADTVLERMRREKQKHLERAGNSAEDRAAFKKAKEAAAARGDAPRDLLEAIKEADVDGVRRFLANAKTTEDVAVTDRMKNGAWHASCRVQSQAAAIEIASMFIKYRLPMNVRSSIHNLLPNLLRPPPNRQLQPSVT